MLVGLVADTHVPDRQPQLPAALFDALAGVEHILHAGDITRAFVLEELARIAPVTAVRGDWDDPAMELPWKRVVTLGGRRIGLIHGRRSRWVEGVGVLFGLVTRRVWTPGLDRWLLSQFEDEPVDMIVYGHLHRPRRVPVNGVWLVNPGGVWTGPLEQWIQPVARPGVALLDTENLHVTFKSLEHEQRRER